ncbi:unnamed protein product [Caenorhabditis auriculariae]|uniref:Lipocalin domain-containing protein n=1 Tax=Caenorhabditis auriculariae TaxID=2777116 RepID=A0A8S1H3W9_9PELO|nr:unnamed protein product [Caenorhabditis auriculariae]
MVRALNYLELLGINRRYQFAEESRVFLRPTRAGLRVVQCYITYQAAAEDLSVHFWSRIDFIPIYLTSEAFSNYYSCDMNSIICIINLLILIFHQTSAVTPFLGGVPVPGRTVPILRLFENYASSCRPKEKKDFSMDQLAQLVQSLQMDEVAHKVYHSLFFAMADMQIQKFMGKWYTVVDSKRIHAEDCGVFQFELLMQTEFTATFSSRLNAVQNGEDISYEGYGTMVGPDPGEVLLTTGHPNDQCPYFPVKLGGLNKTGDYEYMILSTPLKYPTMVLARNVERFEAKHKKEVYDFVEKYGFMSPLAALNTRLHFTDIHACQRSNNLFPYSHI